MYRSPNNKIELFIDELENLIFIETEYSKVDYKIIVGEMNLDFLNDTTIKNRYFTLMSENGYFKIINKITRYASNIYLESRSNIYEM